MMGAVKLVGWIVAGGVALGALVTVALVEHYHALAGPTPRPKGLTVSRALSAGSNAPIYVAVGQSLDLNVPGTKAALVGLADPAVLRLAASGDLGVELQALAPGQSEVRVGYRDAAGNVALASVVVHATQVAA